ncbi:MAG: class I SAM-dependent methyltransferase [Clostridia bacterium]|nr:class I SAM-dependent methyltransferase [Clostridia bacterium]
MNSEESLQRLRLNPRLLKIAELVSNCESLADIGTDHGYIPIYALLKGTAKSAIASDINKGPIKRAKKNVLAFGLADKISLRVGPGLTTVEAGEAETIVIAGMGGILISDILEESKKTVSLAKQLILQPMTAEKELREYLCTNNFTIEEEILVAEEEKIYNIICVSPGGRTEYSSKELVLGRGLENTSPMLFEEYKRRILTKLEIKLAGLSKSDLDKNKAEAHRVRQLIEEIKN